MYKRVDIKKKSVCIRGEEDFVTNLTRKKINILSVCVLSNDMSSHSDVMILCIKWNEYILCKKPMCSDWSEWTLAINDICLEICEWAFDK